MSQPDLRSRIAQLAPLPPAPLVSVIMAVRNEAPHIMAALDAVRLQDWPREALEIIVADGDSEDGTREMVAGVAARDPRVRLVRNPHRYVAQGLNRAIAASRGAVVVRVDGHCRIPASYVRAAVEALRSGEAECAGGPIRTRARSAIGASIALAMSTRWGVGGATFRVARERRLVDHLPFGAWRRETLAALGGFDERFVRNQDDELSDRLRRDGGRILLLPEQVVDYWCRDSLAGLARQYFGYGLWKVQGIRARGGAPASLRHVVPALLLTASAAGVLLAAVLAKPLLALATPAAYSAFLAVATMESLVTSGRAARGLPLVLPVLHAAYGAGFLRALLPGAPVMPAHASLMAGASAASEPADDERLEEAA